MFPKWRSRFRNASRMYHWIVFVAFLNLKFVATNSVFEMPSKEKLVIIRPSQVNREENSTILTFSKLCMYAMGYLPTYKGDIFHLLWKPSVENWPNGYRRDDAHVSKVVFARINFSGKPTTTLCFKWVFSQIIMI